MAGGDLGGGGILLGGLGRTGAGRDVEVLQDVVVDFRGDLLPLQHLPDGLVGGVGADRRALPGGLRGNRTRTVSIWSRSYQPGAKVGRLTISMLAHVWVEANQVKCIRDQNISATR